MIRDAISHESRLVGRAGKEERDRKEIKGD